MKVEEIISREIKDKGLKLISVSEKSGVRYSLLQPSMTGRRELRADEFLQVCATIGLKPEEVWKQSLES